MEFKYAGGGLAKGGRVTLYVDAKEAGSPTGPEATDSAARNWVQIDLEKDGRDHPISPEERYRVTMARQ